MPSEFAPAGGKPRVTKKQIKQMQENYVRAAQLLEDTSVEEAREKSEIDAVFDAEFDAVFSTPQKVGVCIGRFQPLHKGHENILKQMVSENDLVIVCIGRGGEDKNNIFSYDICYSFFESYISGNFFVEGVDDTPNDREWVGHIASLIDSHTIANSSLRFYGGDFENDSAIQVLHKYMSEFYERDISYREVSRTKNRIAVAGRYLSLSGTLCREAFMRGDQIFLQKAVSEEIYRILQHLTLVNKGNEKE